jgi:hypothetical protein
VKWYYRCKTAVDGSIPGILWMIDVLFQQSRWLFSRSNRVLVGISLARFSHADLSFGSSGHRAFRPLQSHTLVIMDPCQFKCFFDYLVAKPQLYCRI